MENNIPEKYDMKPGLAFIDERTKQFRYADDTGSLQWTQPISRYKTLTKIKRGQAVSVATKEDLYDYAYESTATVSETPKVYELLGSNPTETVGTLSTIKTTEYTNIQLEFFKYVSTETITRNENSEPVSTFTDEFFNNGVKFNFPLTIVKKYEGKETGKNVYTFDKDTLSLYCTEFTYNEEKALEVIGDPEACVVPTNTKKHQKCIGLALDYSEGYGGYIHAASFGKFTFDTDYEGTNNWFFEGTEGDNVFDHTGKEYNPGFSYEDAGKKVYVKCPYTTEDGVEHLGELTLNEVETYKNYHNIIYIGQVTDAPSNDKETKTSIEIAISGDQRGLVDSTQFEVTLGEDIVIPTTDPIRVLAVGQEEDTNFKARICFTPQGGTFTNSDFIAFQKMDGKTVVIPFSSSGVDLKGSSNNEDAAFLHMAQSYIDIFNVGKSEKEKLSISTVKLSNAFFNDDINNADSINNNIDLLEPLLETAFKGIINETIPDGEKALSITKVKAKTDNYFGAIDIESTIPGGYYTLYVSSSLRSRLDGTAVINGGSYENKGKAVLADIRIPTRRSLIGIYYGSDFDTLLKKDSVTLVMRLGEYNLPDTNNGISSWEDGQDYYLGMQGCIVKYPYNQFDFVSKIGFIKTDNNGDRRLLVDIGSATRHYNGDLPVGYMKPAVKVNNSYGAEKGFLLMDGKVEKPINEYEALYTRLLGWFEESQIRASTGKEKTHFKVPKVVKLIPDYVDGDENNNSESNTKQVEVPMQIKAIADGIYEEMPRIPFKRFFGKFLTESENSTEQVKACIEACEITDIIDYGINDNGYTLPGIDTLDIHLFVDTNENYDPNGNEPHDWREVHEGFFNYNNSITYGYTWRIENKGCSVSHPFGEFDLVMDIGEGAGVAYVTDKNQSPLRLNGCYFKLYVSRREVFTRQFDIEGIYRNYITNTIYTNEKEDEVVVNKAVSGKAVLDAIRNIKAISNLSATGDNATVELGPLDKPVKKLVLNTESDLPIISNTKIYIGNSVDTHSFEIINDRIYKRKNYDENIFDLENGTSNYKVAGDELVSAAQARNHAEITLDGVTSLTKYLSDNVDNKHGKIHGMVFGRDGNIDVNSIWSYKPELASNIHITKESTPDGYIPVTVKNNNIYETHIEGNIKYVPSGASQEVLVDSYAKVENYKYGVLNDGDLDSKVINQGQVTDNFTRGKAVVKTSNVSEKTFIENISNTSVGQTIQKVYDTENGTLQLFFHKADNNGVSGVNLYAGNITSASLSRYKRIHGELIRDTSLTPTTLADGSIKYTDEDNKLKTTLGSALQAAYELPLAYWQYNTEKEWSKDSLGIIIERVKDVIDNIDKSPNATFAHIDWADNVATSKISGSEGNKIELEVTVEENKNTVIIYFDGTEKYKFNPLDATNVCENDLVSFNVTSWISLDRTFLFGGEDSTVQRNIFDNLTTDTNYKENKFYYTDDEELSIKSFLSSIIDNSGNGQNITSTVGMLLMAAKESQERLLKLEASTFGRDYETIPGNHVEYNISIPGVTKDPTNYGLNRLIRAICKELYLDTNPFDINGNANVPTSSFSRIDKLDRDIHGSVNNDNATTTAENELDKLDSSKYPYPDMINDTVDTDIRLGKVDADESVTSRGNNVKTRIHMDKFNGDENEYTGEVEDNTYNQENQFNGVVDAIYRITTKLDALTVSVNNSDNIADRPVRLDTIRSNIATLLEEAFFNGKETTKLVGGKYETSMNTENDYKDVSGENNKPYPTSSNESRLEKLSKALYDYTLKLTQNEIVLGLKADQKFGTEGKFYTTRVFNGKQLLVDNVPTTSGLDKIEDVEMSIPTNIENYEYANVIDILIDAIGDDWLRKDSMNSTPNASNAVSTIETRSAKTITKRLFDIEKCLDVIVSKISRQHNFEAEIENTINENDIDSVANKDKLSSANKVYSIEKYLGFLNDYLGTEQHTNDKITDNNPNINSYVEQAWVQGIDKIGDVEFDLNKNVEGKDPIPIGLTKYGAEWAIKNKKNIHAGLVNMLARLQREESISTAFGKMLGEDFDWQAANIQKKVDEKTGIVTWEDISDTSKYTLTDDIKDILLTLYGQDKDELEDTSTGYIVDNLIATKHRGLISSTNNINRFVADGKNIVDAIVNEMYYIPQPIRLENGNYVKVTANTSASLDSRSADFYDFDSGNNVYDIINNEKALGYGNRNEFFNDIGYFTDNETKDNSKLHYRLSRFEVLEKEIRSLRKLIGNNLSGSYINNEDWLALKFNGELKYTNNKFNDIIEASINDNDGSQTNTSGTNILQFLLNNDAANRKLRNELGNVSGNNVYYSSTYSQENPITDSGVSIKIDDNNTLSYPLFQGTKSLYERVKTLEENATQVDAWIDSIKDNYRDEQNGNKQGNIYDIIDYLGDYKWESNKYYGAFTNDLGRYIESQDLKRTVNVFSGYEYIYKSYSNVSEELKAHNTYLADLYNIIGFDNNNGKDFIESDEDDSSRSVQVYNTLWARINAVETLNKNDVDITNIVTVSKSIPENSTKSNDNSTIQPRVLNDEKDTLVTLIDGENGMTPTNTYTEDVHQKSMVASVGYVDNSIIAKSNEILGKTGYQKDDWFGAGTWGTANEKDVNSYGWWKSIFDVRDDYGYTSNNGIAYEKTGAYIKGDTTTFTDDLTYIEYGSGIIFNEWDDNNKNRKVSLSEVQNDNKYYVYKNKDSLNAEKAREEDVLYNSILNRNLIANSLEGIAQYGKMVAQATNNVYKRVQTLYDAFGLNYDKNRASRITTGSLLTWDKNNNYDGTPSKADIDAFISSCTYESYSSKWPDKEYYTWLNPNDNVRFANFRKLPGCLNAYRGASPCCNDKGRKAIASSVVETNEINCILNLEDSLDDFNKSNPSKYIQGIYDSGNMAVDFYNYSDTNSDANKAVLRGLVNKLTSIMNNLITKGVTPKLYIHCVEGKFRAAFVSFLFECLCGATYDQMEADFMESYYNYYGVRKANTFGHTDDTETANRNNAYYNAGVKAWFTWDLETILGKNYDLGTADFAGKAKEYLISCGVEDSTLNTLVYCLQYTNE